MKFYGIDCQGYLKIQQPVGVTPPAFVSGTDERKLIYIHNSGADDELYFGGDENNDWVRVVLDDGSGSYSNLTGALDGSYHVSGGDTSTSFTASEYNGDGTNHIRGADDWLKLSNGVPQTTGTAGIKVEMGTALNDTDDAMIYWDGDNLNWYLDNTVDAASTIATQDWVSDNFANSGDLTGDYYTAAQVDAGFVPNTDPDWLMLTGTGAANRYYYLKQEAHAGFVRTTNWTIDSPPTTAGDEIYATASNVANTVVMRDGTSDIYCDILHGTATSAYYADLAEKYICDEDTPWGTVMEVSFGTDEEVVPCMFELSPSVVGITSENPAHLMNAGGEGLPIALAGRVPVRITGEVKKGDFIVPAGNGVARKGEPSELSFKIGIALDTNLQKDEKLVECVIK